MGLDMYLEAEFYVGGGWTHIRQAENAVAKHEAWQFDTLLTLFGMDFSTFKEKYPEGNYAHVSIEVGYWRKANAIHSWFVNNVQDGRDECQRSYVEEEKLAELLDACQRILATVVKGEPVTETGLFGSYETFPDLRFDTALAEQLLETKGGFFFGGTDYDGWYIHNLEETVKQLDIVLNDPKLKDASLYYRASW